MPKRIKTTAPNNVLSRAELMLVRLAFLFAFGISAFLAWNSLQGGGVPGCGPESNCDKVLTSRWAYIAGLPVSLFALPVYAAALFFLFQKVLRWNLLLPVAILILAAALWFVGLQAFALRAFCKFCMTAHVLGAFGALYLLSKNPLPAPATLRFAGIAAIPFCLLVVAQAMSSAPGPVKLVSNLITNSAPVLASAPTTNTPASPTQQAASVPVTTNISTQAVAKVSTSNAVPTFTFVEGQFTLDLTRVPVSGPLNAPKKMVKLFDYTCHHCRDLHHLLKPVKAAHSNELAVIYLPLPLDAGCNPVLKSTPAAHVNACQYAQLALAVSVAYSEKFEEYSDWLFAPERPPTVEAARKHAEDLVGKAALDMALNDPRVAQQIKQDVEIYMATKRLSGRGALPQLLFTRGGSIGAIRTAKDLNKVLSEGIGLASVTEPAATTNSATAQP